MLYQEALTELDELEAQLKSKRIAFIETYNIPHEICDLFLGNVETASRWIFTSQPALDNTRPVNLLDEQRGRERVITLIQQLAHGVIP